MLTKEQRKMIKQCLNPECYDVDKLIRYLEMHDTVGNEVFQYCDKHRIKQDEPTYTHWLDEEDGYQPLSVEQFVRRAPFYFYVPDVDLMDPAEVSKKDLELSGTLDYIYSASLLENEVIGKPDIEKIYEILEYTFYDLRLPLPQILSYWVAQTGNVSGRGFFQWYEYLRMLEGAADIEYFPERFITAYNEALEAAGREPIVYEVQAFFDYEFFFRHGTQIEFEGQFPCGENDQPIMKWIGIRAKNVGSIRCTCKRSKIGKLFIEIKPTSVVHLLNVYNNGKDDDGTWYQIYAGPLCMEFDFTVLKERRKRMKFTQQEVADAIGATVRTYQKWENGETTPDGHYLLRLMNWLDIPDAQYAVKYTDA